MRLALYQPDNPQNAGALVRLAACLGVALDVIEPCGFPWDDRRLKRVALDYAGLTRIARHTSWPAFQAARSGRLLLLTTSGDAPYDGISYRADDVLMVGRESAGVPEEVHRAADARLVIPMAAGARSLNVVTAAAIALAEARRQIAARAEAKPPAVAGSEAVA